VLQSLVVVLQSSELDDDDFEHIIRGIHLARQYLGTLVLEVILSAVSLPAFGYMGHVIYTWPQTVPQFVKWISAIPFFFAILIVWVFFPAIATLPLLAFDYLSQSQPCGRFVPDLYIMFGALTWGMFTLDWARLVRQTNNSCCVTLVCGHHVCFISLAEFYVPS
jgi:hypothetical protein